MNIFRLSQSDVQLFNRLDPYGLLSFLECPNGFAFGCLEDEDEELALPPKAGLIIASALEKELTIHWLAVDAEGQGLGMGSALLKKMFEVAESAGIPELSVLIAPEYEKEVFSAGAESFFAERFFIHKRDLTGIWQGPLFALMQEKTYKSDTDKLPKTKALSEFPADKRSDIIRQLSEIEGHISFYDLNGEPEGFDPELSYVIMDGNEAWGGLIVKKLSDSVIPVYFYADSLPEARALAVSAAGKADQKCGKDVQVSIILTGRYPYGVSSIKKAGKTKNNEAWENTMDYAAKLIPEVAKGGCLLSAHIDEYLEFQEDSYKNI